MNTKSFTLLLLLNSSIISEGLASSYFDKAKSHSEQSYECEELDVRDPKIFYSRLRECIGGERKFETFEEEIDDTFRKISWKHPIKGIKASPANIVQGLKRIEPAFIVSDYNYNTIFNFNELLANSENFTKDFSFSKLFEIIKCKLCALKPSVSGNKEIPDLEFARSVFRETVLGDIAINNWPFWDKGIEYFGLLKKLNDPKLIQDAENIFKRLCYPGDRFEISVTFNKHLQLLRLYNSILNKPEIEFETRFEFDDFFKVFAQTQRNEIVELLNKANQNGFQCGIFYGTPGVGKDSTINQLVTLNLSDAHRTRDSLVQLLQERLLSSGRNMNHFQIITIEGELMTREENPMIKEFLKADNWSCDKSGHVFFTSGIFQNPIPLLNTLVIFTTNYNDCAQEFLLKYTEHPLKNFMKIIEFGRFDQKNVEEITIPNFVRDFLENKMKRMSQQDRDLIETRLGVNSTNWWNSIKESGECEEVDLIRNIDLMKEDLFIPLPIPGEINVSMRKLGGEIRKLINLYIRDLLTKGE